MAITFNGTTKTITLTSGTTTLGVRDLWSRWVDWWVTSDNSKYAIAFEQVGGNDIDVSAGTSIPIYAFMKNGWRIKPQEANHTLNVNDGILLVDGGGDPFINTTGSFIVRINYSQPVQAITVATGGGSGSGATPAEIWSYSTRTLTESAGLTTEQATQLSEVHANVDIKSSDIRAVGGGGFSSQAIQTSLGNAKREIIEQIKEIPQVSLENVENQLSEIKDFVNEIDSHITLAKEETIDTIKASENEICSDIIRKSKELKEDNVKTRNLVRQKSEKVVKYAEKQLDMQEQIEKEIEDTENEIKEEFDRIEADEKEIADLFDQYDKDEEEIKAEFDKLESNT